MHGPTAVLAAAQHTPAIFTEIVDFSDDVLRAIIAKRTAELSLQKRLASAAAPLPLPPRQEDVLTPTEALFQAIDMVID